MAIHNSSSSIQLRMRFLLTFFLYIQIATSLVISLRNDSTVDKGVGTNEDDPFCADSPDWEYKGDQESDCLGAIRMLHDHEVSKHGHAEFEFLPDGVHQHLSLAITRTPRKYVYSE